MDIVQIAAIALLLIVAFFTDIRSQIIPNRLTLSFFIGALIYQLAANGSSGLIALAAGTAAGFAPLLLLYFAKGIGAGDVKLFGAIGAWVGVGTVLQLMLYSILYAGLIGLFLVIVHGSLRKKVAAGVIAIIIPAIGWKGKQWLQWAESGKKFPFMLAVLPAAVTVWYMII